MPTAYGSDDFCVNNIQRIHKRELQRELIQGDWYYFNAEGYVQTGWIQVGDKQYYLDGDGKMKTGWLQSGGNWYYLGVSGDMKTGWVETAPGEWYYMDADGKMLANTVVEGYQLNENGLMVK